MSNRKAKGLHVRYERDENAWWVVSIKEVPGCHTQGRTIAQARRRAREALGLFRDDARRIPFLEEVKLSPQALKALKRLTQARARASAAEAEARASTQAAVKVLVKRHQLSVRDASELLGLSHQRVQQVVQKKAS